MLVAALLNRASRRTGMQTTGSERTEALDALNDVYLEAIMDSRLNMNRVSYTMVTALDLYDVSSLIGSIPLGLVGVGRVHTDGRYEAFEVVSHDELTQNQSRSSGGDTVQVAPLGVSKLMFWPNVSVGDVIRFYYLPAVTALAETGNNDPAVLVPVQFHQSVLLAGTILQLLDKDQRKSDVEFWGNRYESGKAKMALWAEQFMGESPRMFASTAGRRVTMWPDERRRG